MLKGDKQQSMASLRLNNKTAEWWKKTERDGRGVEEEETSGLSSVCLCVRPGTCSYEKTDISSCYHTGEVDIMSNFWVWVADTSQTQAPNSVAAVISQKETAGGCCGWNSGSPGRHGEHLDCSCIVCWGYTNTRGPNGTCRMIVCNAHGCTSKGTFQHYMVRSIWTTHHHTH